MPCLLCFVFQCRLHMQSLLGPQGSVSLICLTSHQISWKSVSNLSNGTAHPIDLPLHVVKPQLGARGADLVVAETESEANIIRGCALDAIFELQLSQARFEKLQRHLWEHPGCKEQSVALWLFGILGALLWGIALQVMELRACTKSRTGLS